MLQKQNQSRCMQATSLSGWEHTEGYPVDVVQEPVHVAHITAKGPEHISTAAISHDGSHMAFAGAAAGSMRMYKLSGGEVSIPFLTVIPPPCVSVHGQHLFGTGEACAVKVAHALLEHLIYNFGHGRVSSLSVCDLQDSYEIALRTLMSGCSYDGGHDLHVA